MSCVLPAPADAMGCGGAVDVDGASAGGDVWGELGCVLGEATFALDEVARVEAA